MSTSETQEPFLAVRMPLRPILDPAVGWALRRLIPGVGYTWWREGPDGRLYYLGATRAEARSYQRQQQARARRDQAATSSSQSQG